MSAVLRCAVAWALVIAAPVLAAEPRISHAKLPGTWSADIAAPGVKQAVGKGGNASRAQATLGDWSVQCSDRAGTSPCVMAQSAARADKPNAVLRMTVSYAPATGRYDATLRFPPDFRPADGAVLRLDRSTKATIYGFSDCDAAGCYAARQLSAGDVAALRSASSAAVTAVGDTRSTVLFPVSLTGFASAMDLIVARSGERTRAGGTRVRKR